MYVIASQLQSQIQQGSKIMSNRNEADFFRQTSYKIKC